jgi:hypothetical protein
MLHATTSSGMRLARMRASHERVASGGLRFASVASTLLCSATVASSLYSTHRRSASTAAASTLRPVSASAEKAMLTILTCW